LKTLQVLRRLQKDTKAEVYLVGGYVRDLLRKKKNEDLDVVIRKLTLKEIRNFLKKYGPVKVVRLSNKGNSATISMIYFRAKGDKQEAQITQPRRGKRQIPDSRNSLKQDCQYRDFRINAMYLPIDYKSRNDVIDITGGKVDIMNRTINTNGSAVDRFKESPVRMLRAVTLAAQTGYTLSDEILGVIPHMVDLLETIPFENIRDHLNKVLLSKKPSKFFKLMNRLNMLSYVLPELERCIGVKQDRRYHKYDVFTHSIYACDNADPDINIRLAALLHDIGKPDTRKFIGDRITFHKHESVGASLTKIALTRLKYDNATIAAVSKLVQLHMYHYTSDVYKCTADDCRWARPTNAFPEGLKQCPICDAPVEITSGWTDNAVRRFIKKAKINDDNIDDLSNIPLFRLRQAERLGNGLKTTAVTEKQKDFEGRIRDVYERGASLEMKDLDIDGNIIMKTFHLKPSQKVGDILNFVLEKVRENKQLNNRLSLLKLATEYLYQESVKNE
jgi:tRNA nucleotidyltransferase (CCA-adding enzyme)